MPRLRRVSCADPGYTRRRCGRGFVYVDADGRRISDASVLARIAALVIPPAWSDVWICASPNGHLQAVGTDSKGRRQYRYHDQWRRDRDREKFARMLDFGAALPGLRARCVDHLLAEGSSRDTVLAASVRLLDLGCFRIGSDRAAEENETFGLTTLTRSHVRVRPPVIRFDYPGKGGVQQQMQVMDELTADLIARLARRRGGDERLLAWQASPRGPWRTLAPPEVNGFIHEVTGGPFSAKDFRTLRATVLAAAEFGRIGSGPPGRRSPPTGTRASGAARRRATAEVMRRVSGFLGNTPTVCRNSYVDPRVVDRFATGHTIADASAEVADLLATTDDLTTTVPQAILEAAVLAWLPDDPEEVGVAA